MEQRPNRGTDQPPRIAETLDVWPRWNRTVTGPDVAVYMLISTEIATEPISCHKNAPYLLLADLAAADNRPDQWACYRSARGDTRRRQFAANRQWDPIKPFLRAPIACPLRHLGRLQPSRWLQGRWCRPAVAIAVNSAERGRFCLWRRTMRTAELGAGPAVRRSRNRRRGSTPARDLAGQGRNAAHAISRRYRMYQSQVEARVDIARFKDQSSASGHLNA